MLKKIVKFVNEHHDNIDKSTCGKKFYQAVIADLLLPETGLGKLEDISIYLNRLIITANRDKNAAKRSSSGTSNGPSTPNAGKHKLGD